MSADLPRDVSYVLPLRWENDDQAEELTAYLRWLAGRAAEVIVVDGSGPDLFATHARAWGSTVRHITPDPTIPGANGKARGAVTGVRAARRERVVIADDDVRYDDAGLRAAASALDDADLVVPQNYFRPLPWHAAWDTARTLLNRAVGHDFPGTLAVRHSAFLAAGAYDCDVLFENLELIRTIRAAGGVVAAPLDLYVRRLAPTPGRFLGQRVRQAYDEFARPPRLAAALAVVPMFARLLARRRYGKLAAAAGAATLVAELGRRRAGGTRVFPAQASLLAPLWILERGVTSWIAVGFRVFRGGIPYGGRIVRRAGGASFATGGPRRGSSSFPGGGLPAAGVRQGKLGKEPVWRRPAPP